MCPDWGRLFDCAHSWVLIPLISGHVSGQKLNDEGQPDLVLIPLISGHVSGQKVFVKVSNPLTVLIPLISGHVSGHVSREVAWLYCLNPFDIRACVRTLMDGLIEAAR